MNFQDLGLAQPIVRAIAAEGYATPTPIQAQAIPVILTGKDIFGCAQTGTGKTGAFAMPVLSRLAPPPAQPGARPRNNPAGGRARALVLCPTRELAMQIFESFRTYGRHLGLRYVTIFGGVNQNPQVRALRTGVDVIVATPGRLQDLMEQGHVDLSAVETLVLDEADRMLDMGFVHDIRRIAEELPESRQTLLFSATMPTEIRKLASTLLRDPEFIQVAPVASTAAAITQSVYHVSGKNKPELLQRLLRDASVGRTLVFTRTKFGADRLVKTLRESGIDAGAIHGNKTQAARTKTLHGFKTGRTSVLVATDIASRGIDVDQISHVFNFDMPNDPETYVHRIGRTARAGASGTAFSFCDHHERSGLRAIERLIGSQLKVMDNEPDLAMPAPSQRPPHAGGGHAPGSGGAGGSGPRRHRGPFRGGRSKHGTHSAGGPRTGGEGGHGGGHRAGGPKRAKGRGPARASGPR